jgi:hypothetical protein
MEESYDDDQFEYLFDLPYEMIIQVLSNLSLKETDDFCNRLAKEVKYGEEKLHLKDLCQEIWRIKYIAMFGNSDKEISNWRSEFMSRYRDEFRKKIYEFINKIKSTTGDKRINSLVETYQYIKENKELLRLKEFQKLKQVFMDKLIEFMNAKPEFQVMLFPYFQAIFD